MKEYAKAIVGGLVGGLTAAGTALSDGSVTAAEWVGIALAFVLGTGLVAATPDATLARQRHGQVIAGPASKLPTGSPVNDSFQVGDL